MLLAAAARKRTSARRAAAASVQQTPPAAGCSEITLNKSLASIRRKLDMVSFGKAKHKNVDAEISRLVEGIRQVTEWIMWGENHNAGLFDLFCEHEMLACFLATLRAAQSPYTVKLQVLQSLSIIVQNVQRETSIIFLLSGGLFNTFFADPPILDDEEMMAYFVTLLKGVVRRLHADNAQLCLTRFKRDANSGFDCMRMPVFDQSVLLLCHREGMIQTAARTTILSIARIESPLVKEAIEASIVSDLAPTLAQISIDISQRTDSSPGGQRDTIRSMEEMLAFVGDLFGLNLPTVSAALVQEGFAIDDNDGVVFLRE